MSSAAYLRPSRWNKGTVTHIAAVAFVVSGLVLPEPFRRPLLYLGLFALSGAITNWLAIHMLFERVPGLYGSGVIPARFEDIKREIHRLVMEQFFSPSRIERFFAQETSLAERFNFDKVIDETDLSPIFDAFVSVVETSSLGGLLGMFGGTAALEPLREPFSVRMKQAFKDLSETDAFQEAVQSQLSSPNAHQAVNSRIEVLVQERLDELTPQQIKDIMQNMIRDHLGWLVVWGGVFGGLIGLLTSMLPFV